MPSDNPDTAQVPIIHLGSEVERLFEESRANGRRLARAWATLMAEVVTLDKTAMDEFNLTVRKLGAFIEYKDRDWPEPPDDDDNGGGDDDPEPTPIIPPPAMQPKPQHEYSRPKNGADRHL